MDQRGGRILLGDKNGGRAVVLRPIMFQCIEIGCQLDFLVYTHTVGHMYAEL
jgi:hypothetical protein